MMGFVLIVALSAFGVGVIAGVTLFAFYVGEQISRGLPPATARQIKRAARLARLKIQSRDS